MDDQPSDIYDTITMLEVIEQNYIRTARAYGVPERTILYRYALKNAIVPTLTVLGLTIAFLLTGAFGLVLSNHKTWQKIIYGTLLSSVAFFVITNLGAWLSSPLYPKNFVGLTECFIAAIPFFRNTLLGNLVFITAIVLAIESIRKYVLSPGLRTSS